MSEDKYSVSGFKSWAITKGIDYLQKKISDGDLDDIIDKIDDTFPDKHSIEVMIDLRILISRFFLRLQKRITEIKRGDTPLVAEDKQEVKEPKKTERKKRVGRRKKR